MEIGREIGSRQQIIKNLTTRALADIIMGHKAPSRQPQPQHWVTDSCMTNEQPALLHTVLKIQRSICQESKNISWVSHESDIGTINQPAVESRQSINQCEL